MLPITKKTSTKKTTKLKAKRKPFFIIIHYTAGFTSKKGSASNTANYFATSNKEASADFIVDDGSIVQYNPDIENRYTWAVGGPKEKNKTTSQSGLYYNLANNENSISIEMCSNKKSTKTQLATDRDWFFTEATLQNAADLTKYLMEKYNIPFENVIMHHHRTGKLCPAMWSWDEKALEGWKSFKARLQTNSFVYNGLDYSLVFDPKFYSQKYPDLANAGIKTNAQLFNHFINFGMKERRQGISTFNVVAYSSYYVDLRNAFGANWPSYYKHYITNGYKEKRKCV